MIMQQALNMSSECAGQIDKVCRWCNARTCCEGQAKAVFGAHKQSGSGVCVPLQQVWKLDMDFLKCSRAGTWHKGAGEDVNTIKCDWSEQWPPANKGCLNVRQRQPPLLAASGPQCTCVCVRVFIFVCVSRTLIWTVRSLQPPNVLI